MNPSKLGVFICATIVACCFTVPAARSETAPLISIEKFANENIGQWQLSGDAKLNQSNLRLTRSDLWLQGMALSKKPISLPKDRSFSAYFSFLMTDPECYLGGLGADGIAFVFQHTLVAPHAPGSGMGYANRESTLAIEFDTHENNGFLDLPSQHIGVNVQGNLISYDSAAIPFLLNDGQVYHTWIDYDGSANKLEVRLSDSNERPDVAMLESDISLAGILQDQVYVGISAATGVCKEQHDITSFKFHNAKLTNGIEPKKSVAPKS